jgi:hypothetical protein
VLDLVNSLNFSGLSESEISQVRQAIVDDDESYGYIPSKAFEFILRNYKQLAALNALEPNWGGAYLSADDFSNVSIDYLQAIFDACRKDVLQKHFPVHIEGNFTKGRRFNLFRGCAGDDHRMGMSWTDSLDKAIFYAAKHQTYKKLGNLAVYASVVCGSEIYCSFRRNENEFIVRPKEWWQVDVPITEFRLDRPR